MHFFSIFSSNTSLVYFQILRNTHTQERGERLETRLINNITFVPRHTEIPRIFYYPPIFHPSTRTPTLFYITLHNFQFFSFIIDNFCDFFFECHESTEHATRVRTLTTGRFLTNSSTKLFSCCFLATFFLALFSQRDWLCESSMLTSSINQLSDLLSLFFVKRN